MTLDKNLETIKHWLKKNAARIANESLNPGASQAGIDELHAVVKKELPGDLVTLYKTWNGLNEDENLGNLFYAMDFLSLDRMIDDFNNHTNQANHVPLKKADTGIDTKNMSNPYWLQIASDSGHASLRVDLTPGTGGTYGQVIFVDEEFQIAILMATSVADLVQKFADDLVQGRYTLNEDALADENHFLETHQTIDVVNWFKNDRWKHLSE